MAEVEGDGAGAALPDGGAASAVDEEIQQWGPFVDARSAVIGARCLKVLGWVHDVACLATRRGESIGFTLLRALHASGGPVQLLCVGVNPMTLSTHPLLSLHYGHNFINRTQYPVPRMMMQSCLSKHAENLWFIRFGWRERADGLCLCLHVGHRRSNRSKTATQWCVAL